VFARVSTYHADDASKMMEGFRSVTGALEEIDGFSGAYFLVDRQHNRALSITLWRDEEAINASQQKADELRQQGSSVGGGSIDSVEHFEVAITVGAVANG
jgi:heme-degrading monooxygenase HmoA